MNEVHVLKYTEDYVVVLAVTRWFLVGGRAVPVEGIDANGDIHTIPIDEAVTYQIAV